MSDFGSPLSDASLEDALYFTAHLAPSQEVTAVANFLIDKSVPMRTKQKLAEKRAPYCPGLEQRLPNISTRQPVDPRTRPMHKRPAVATAKPGVLSGLTVLNAPHSVASTTATRETRHDNFTSVSISENDAFIDSAAPQCETTVETERGVC